MINDSKSMDNFLNKLIPCSDSGLSSGGPLLTVVPGLPLGVPPAHGPNIYKDIKP